MPTIPIYDRQQVQVAPFQAPRAPLSAPDYLAGAGAGFLDLSTTLDKIQAGADIAEEARLRREGGANMTAAIKDAVIKYSDPTEFSQAAPEVLKTAYENSLAAASNDRVRNRLSGNLSGELINRQTDIRVNTHLKNIDKAEGNWITFKTKSIKDYNATDDPVEKSRISTELQKTLAGLTTANLITYNAAKKEIAILAEQMSEINVKHDFKNDPIGTIEKMDKGDYSKNLQPEKLDQLKDHFATSYRVAQADIKQKVAEEQDNNFADAMVRARKGQLSAAEVDRMATLDPATGKRAIDAQQAVHLSNQVSATAASGGVLYSDPKTLSDMQYRLHDGKLGADEVRRVQQRGKLTVGDANGLYNGIEGRIRRDRADAREARLDDIAFDPAYKRAEAYITKALPNTDRLDLNHSFRIMVGQTFVDFDQAARAVDENGKPKYGPKDLQGIAENIVDGTLIKMDLAKISAEAKLKPGIKTPEDVAAAVRNGNITPDEAKEQMRLLQMMGVVPRPAAAPAPRGVAPGATVTPSRSQSAQERARGMGGPGVQ